MKRICFIGLVASLMVGGVCNAQNMEVKGLNLPPLYHQMGKAIYEEFDYNYEKASEYIGKGGDPAKMDSVVKAATVEYVSALAPEVSEFIRTYSAEKLQSVADSLSSTMSPEFKTLKNEIMATMKTASPPKPETLVDELGKINLKASETLDDKEKKGIYAITTVTAYSYFYWMTNFTKWMGLRTKVALPEN